MGLRGKIEAAREHLRLLWKEAPEYGDPSNIAPHIGVDYAQTADSSTQRAREGRSVSPSELFSEQLSATLNTAKAEIGRQAAKQNGNPAQTSSNFGTYAVYMAIGFVVGSVAPGIGNLIGLGIGWYMARRALENAAQK